MSSHGSYGLWSAYLAGGDVVVADGYSGHQGGNSIENIWKTAWDYILILQHVTTTHFWTFYYCRESQAKTQVLFKLKLKL